MTRVWQSVDRDIENLRQAGQYKQLKNLTQPMGPVSHIEGIGDVVVLCSNDYLGLANDPEVVEAAIEAHRRWGAGTGSVRFICGTFDYHGRIEKQLADLWGTGDATT